SKLETPGMVIGGMPGVKFTSKTHPINAGEKLYVFSDGVYEVNFKNKPGMMTLDDFAEELAKPARENNTKVRSMFAFSAETQGTDKFEDDYSIVELIFK